MNKKIIGILVCILFIGASVVSGINIKLKVTETEKLTIILEEDFESGWNDWYADNGVWEVGIPTAGPESAHSGENCVGTILGDEYPEDTDSRLICPSVVLPDVSGNERIQLRFWHWFYYSKGDFGQIEVSVFNESSGMWDDWQVMSGKYENESPVWSQGMKDLTVFAGNKVRIAFYHYTNNDIYEELGWYIDDVILSVVIPYFNSPEDFESGWNDWYADNGVWEVGIPTAGPESAHSGENCAGTILGDEYPEDTDSRLICPSVVLPSVIGNEKIQLWFWHWFCFYYGDFGQIEVSVFNESSGMWNEWQVVEGTFENCSPVWSQGMKDLTVFAGNKVRIAFYHYTNNDIYEELGWYIDDVKITGLNSPPSAPIITGPNSGKPGQELTFIFNAVDPDGDDVRFIIDWGDFTSDTTSYVPEGTDKSASHIWDVKDTYTITAYAEDEFGNSGPSTTKQVTIPRNKAINRPFWQFLQSHPNMFPLLQKLLQQFGL